MTKVRKRNGRLVDYDESRIRQAVMNAYSAVHESPIDDTIPDTIIREITPSLYDGMSVEEIQDLVEQTLAKYDFRTAKAYILYREQHTKNREAFVTLKDKTKDVTISRETVQRYITDAVGTFPVDVADVEHEVLANIRDGYPLQSLNQAITLAFRSRIERDPVYNYVTARAYLRELYTDAFEKETFVSRVGPKYRAYFIDSIKQGVETRNYAQGLLDFDLELLADAIDPRRDLKFQYLGLQTLADRYLQRHKDKRIELPQTFWMRVAMGIARNEPDKNERAIEFYNALSEFRLCSSTPTLFNSGTTHPQLSSCYLLTVEDDLHSIFKLYSDDAQLSKWAGGLGNDITPIRGLGSLIKGTNGPSQGIIPFVKIINDTAIAVNQGSLRKGAIAVYLETWHIEIEEYLELKKNVGDERRRTHDLFTANWIPDLFMQRVRDGSHWTLFSPSDTPDLHDLIGPAFQERYEHYEQLQQQGTLTGRRIQAVDLWRKMLGAIFETGGPWMTWKDTSNIRYTNSHEGVVHSSNLCTEILLHTSATETAVCNLASLNLKEHMRRGKLDEETLKATIATAMRMLDNVIDVNFYPTFEAENSNTRHRPVGLGVMGFTDCLMEQSLSYASEEAMYFANYLGEFVSFHAIMNSILLAKERGPYTSYEGSLWSKGILPHDSAINALRARGEHIEAIQTTQPWWLLRKALEQYGIRNSNTQAIAPTATIANIQGVTQSIEPLYTNMFVKTNLSGDFTVVNEHLVRDLQNLNIWDADMLEEIKYNDGSIAAIERIPVEIRRKYPTAFEIEPEWIIEAAALRQQWIDMGISLNLFLEEPNGKRLSDMYFLAWESGLKTTYYLRTRAATHTEKSSVDVNKFGVQARWAKKAVTPPSERLIDLDPTQANCEACE